MGAGRWVRSRLKNPWSTAVTIRWHGGWRRPGSRSLDFGPPRPGGGGRGGAGPVVRYVRLAPSPGSWEVPAGKRPGWSWLPPQGAMARPQRMPFWVRIWCMTPLVDRFAFEWMWWRGGWLIPVDDDGS